IGSAHNDTLTGNASNNFFLAGVGEDSMKGGLGIDTASYEGSAEAVNIQLGAFGGVQSGAFEQNGDQVGDTLISIEKIIGSSHDDDLYGTASTIDILMGGDGEDLISGYGGKDTLFGDGGNDNLSGVAGNQKLFGGDGNDEINGGSGADYINGGSGIDTATYGGPAGVTINLGLPTKLLLKGQKSAGDAKGDKLISIENLFGTSQNDKLTGNAGANSLDGGLGNDTLKGRAGIDQLNGSNGNDTLNGGANNDSLNGGIDSDILIGGTGNDTLFGGANTDKFLFKETGTANADTINDYSGVASDELDFSALLNKPFNLANHQPEDFVQREIVGDDVVIKVDLNGPTGGANFVEVCTLDGYATAPGETTVFIRFENQLFSLDVATGLFA
ncbi:MAG TPA: calcium-binding protein, partial [Methyloceanibacter sp.]|nr:calcium-binding protein [Methyloceanibacter sp.]